MTWNPLDQLPLIVQVWGAMLLGAVLLMLGLFVGLEWRWICYSARVARHRVCQALLRLFTAAGDDPYPQTAASIALAKATQLDDRRRYHVDEDGHPRRLHGLTERRRQLLSACESSPFRKTVR